MGRTFIESENFPISVVNNASAREKGGGGRPPYWEMVFWWTRKPLAGARAVIAASLLPEEASVRDFLKRIYPSYSPPGNNFTKTPHRDNPLLPSEWKKTFQKIRILDPFAGFGSIPLEAIRLGLGEVVAVEFLPTAYIFLKAVLEYPKKYGRRLKVDVERWGRWITENLRRDPDIKELYDEDVAVYIGTWEVRCPVCNGYTPLVGNWWLARVKGKKYAYMRPRVEGDRLVIDIVENEMSGAPSPNIRGRPELAECLLCGSRISYIDPRTGRVYRSKNEVSNKLIRDRLEFYPKHAIGEWNQKLEEYLEGQITLEELRSAKARPGLLVKVKIVNKDLKFEPCSEEDNEKLWRALERFKQILRVHDIPIELIPPYQREPPANFPVLLYGFDKWFKLFNPRQLLTLVKLVKLIREVGKRIEEEKLRGNWGKEEAFKYAEAVTTYLAMWLVNFVRYDSMVTCWDATYWGLLKVKQSLSMRGIAMMWNWCEFEPVLGTKTFLPYTIDGLSYLVSAVSGSSSMVRILLDDATILSKLGNEKFDVIVTDPPYRHDVSYAELSDFYYVWLKRTLSDERLIPRFYADILVYNTQWESFALNEISFHRKRLEYFNIQSTEDYYTKLMGMAFKRMNELLKDDGLLITYFAHSSPEAWIELIEAGWRRANLRVSRAWNFATESVQRVTARGKTALESSIVVIWRKKRHSENVGDYGEVYKEAFESAVRTKERGWKTGLTSSDLFLASMIGALSIFTSYDRILKFGKELTSRDIIRESYAIATRVVANATEVIKSPEALFYLASKALYRVYTKPEGQLALTGIPVEPIILSSQDVIILSYGFLKEKVEKKEKEGVKMFEKSGIIKATEKTIGAKVAQQKTFTLIEPLDPSLKGIKEVLGVKGINPIRMEASGRRLTCVDILHLLEYYAKQGRGEFDIAYRTLYNKYPSLVREAVEMAKVIARFLNDPECSLARLCLKYVEGR